MTVRSNEKKLRRMMEAVADGTLSRRGFIQKMIAVGLTAPMASQLLMNGGIASADEPFKYKPTKRGGGGPLKILYWQGPTLLNPHFAGGTKDYDASRIFYEPLGSWDEDGNLNPVLAAEIPTKENGGVAEDGKSVTWKLKKGVQWHDGKPFTADDCVFNWEYSKDPATAAISTGLYKDVVVEKVDDNTIKVIFPKPTPFWANAFVGFWGQIIPKHLFDEYRGAKSREAPANLKPVGTGPFKFVDFKPGDLTKGELNPNYHVANKPHFDTVEVKGGGDAVSAARACMQTGEYDLGWNLQVEYDILQKLQEGGKGKLQLVQAGNIEHIGVNFTDPNVEVDGEKSSLTTTHPSLSDINVRKALALLIDKASIEKFIYGPAGYATGLFVTNPPKYRSKKTFEFNIDKANKLLDDAGWVKGADGIRAKGDKKLKYVFQTSINAPRQKCQAIIKQACQKAGIDLELKAVVASVFFSSDVANPDTYAHFYTDLQMFTTSMSQPDPGQFMQNITTVERAAKANKWQGCNYMRYSNPKVDDLIKNSDSELDPVKRAAMLIEAHDIAIDDVAIIPVVARPGSHGISNTLKCQLGSWDATTWDIGSWFREA